MFSLVKGRQVYIPGVLVTRQLFLTLPSPLIKHYAQEINIVGKFSSKSPGHTNNHSVTILFPHSRVLRQRHLQIVLQDPHLSGAGQGVHDHNLLVGVLRVEESVPEEAPASLVTISNSRAENCLPESTNQKLVFESFNQSESCIT